VKHEADESNTLREEDREERTVLGPKTGVRLEYVLALIGACVALISGIIAFTWWASGVQSSLNVLLAGQSREIEQTNGLRQRVEKLERDTDILMQVGSPAIRNRLEPIERWKEQIQSSGSPHVAELTKRFNELERLFEAHKAREPK